MGGGREGKMVFSELVCGSLKIHLLSDVGPPRAIIETGPKTINPQM